MVTFVAYDNPMQALSKRYAVFRDGEVVDWKSTKPAAIRRAIFLCGQNLEERLAMNPSKWPQIVKKANDAGEYHAWIWENIQNLAQTLPNLRSAFLSLVKEESKEWGILPNKLGDAVPPEEVEVLMKAVIENPVFGLLCSNGSPAKMLSLPALLWRKQNRGLQSSGLGRRNLCDPGNHD